MALALASVPGLSLAEGWEFAPPVEVTRAQGDKLFHHLASSGRRSIAVSNDRVAMVWEDERDGQPRVYLSSKRHDQPAFGEAAALSGQGDAFEPAIAALPGERFAVAWEEDAMVWVRLLGFGAAGQPMFGEPRRLSDQAGGQVSLVATGEGLLATWAERKDAHRRIRVARLNVVDSLALQAAPACDVDPAPPAADQLYPTVATTPERVVLAWEDRRPGHTIIMAAFAAPGSDCPFKPPQRISEEPPGANAPYGKGHGVSRVALASYGDGGMIAAWADKRRFRHGYDIWGALLDADGHFGANVRIQDDFGELSQQWHTAVAGHSDGRVVVAWEDKREGHADIALSWPEQGGWSEDLLVPVASGPGEQQHPTISFDANGRLHLAWVHRERPGGPTRLRYSVGTYHGD